jgi:ATP-dependent Lon protease
LERSIGSGRPGVRAPAITKTSGPARCCARTAGSSSWRRATSSSSRAHGRCPTLKPEPIPVSLKVILLGDADIFHLLDRHDPDFHYQFKVLADFDSEIDREPDGPMRYASVLARLCKEEELLPLHQTAVAKLAEHGARVATRRSKLSARFGRIADIAREASFLAQKENRPHVAGTHVVEAIRRTKARANLPSRRFRQLLKDGTIRVETKGSVVGQVNGLAVMSAGPITYGFPARITASMGAGTAGIINIEGQAQLSGAIHTKGFHILGGLLRHLLQTDHPLAFSASVAFEQSYGGIDGDSASGAEICCLLSALTGVPIRQEMAITGAIDQVGHIQAIGGVNEKIEGFFDTCQDLGLSGEQGVVIPKANSGDLMLRPDVVEACRAGKFRIYAVERVEEALEVLTGRTAGERDEEGEYPEESLLGMAVDKAREFWLRSVQSPNVQFVTELEDEEGAEQDTADES